MKKLVALVLAVAMMMTMVSIAFAADGDFITTPESTITATGLTNGDSVSYIKLVEWDATNSNWKLTAVGESCGVTLPELINGITAEEAATIASNVTASGTAMNADAAGTTFTATVAPGMYYLKATPGATNTDTIYNPAFVSADYYEGGNTVAFSTELGSAAYIKKSTIPFDKDVVGADKKVDVAVGDTIPYQITTKIPAYGVLFTDPTFIVTDTLSAGLELDGDVTVSIGGQAAPDGAVTVVKNGTSGFTATFGKDYLLDNSNAGKEVVITYTGKVTTQALENVTYMDNKATLTFSHTPNEISTKEDITRHYTFSIDANLNGDNHGSEKTRELIKIGVDEAGNTITAFTSWVDGQAWTTYTPLGGAKFQLAGNGKTYTAESTAEGYISFNGLDAGTYTLTETEAPAGYIRDTAEHTVTINPSYNGDILTSYTVSIDGSTSEYSITNMSDADATVETTVDNSSTTFPIVNTKGSSLPSTGGIGTTIFYAVGGLMVLGAAIIMVSRRKAEAR